MRGLLRAGADLVSIVEVAYRAEADDERWARAIVDAMSAAVEGALFTSLVVVGHQGGPGSAHLALAVGTGPDVASMSHGMQQVLPHIGDDTFRALFYPGRPVVVQHEIEREISGPAMQMIAGMRAAMGGKDAIGVFGDPRPGLAAVLSAMLDRRVEASRSEHRQLARVAGHLDCAVRLRMRGELEVAGVVSPEGALLELDRTAAKGERERVAHRVVAIERSRLRARRRQSDAIDDWGALIGGRYAVVPREDPDGKRFYLLIENSPITRDEARLSPVESEALRMAATGFSGASAAYSLGLSEAAVSNALRRAADKLGLRSRAALVHVAAALSRMRSNGVDLAALTRTELEILHLLRRGLTNAEIATLRARSPATIAKQVSAILSKTGAAHRRALAALRLKP